MKSDDSLPKLESGSFLDSTPFRVIGVVAFLTVATLALVERQWTSAAFWLAMLIFQELIRRKFRGEKLVKVILVTIIYLLLIIQIWYYISLVNR